MQPPARRQINVAKAWWRANRPAAPNAIAEDLAAMLEVITMTPGIGRPATDVRTPNVRHLRLRRVGYVIYYRVIGSPPVLEIMAFWHSRRGKGPPI
ncbi:MAG TPA: type II toxin-antitoxin system RelE/ParE family toxin [Thermoanaerobaculia bacterium]|nr:type II toxin-antitoxin system RelE/ParE family toxin [Thermoanaerobaculia bacterium]